MKPVLPDLCDENPELVRVIEPMFANFGGVESFSGQIETIKCHEDNSLVADMVAQPGEAKVLVVDGGASMRCGLLGDNLAQKAVDNGWAGIVVYGCIRDVDIIAQLPLGVQALASHPMKSVKRGVGLRGETLYIGGVSIIAGEYLYADNNGVLVSSERLG